jgi:hypothetical protein
MKTFRLLLLSIAFLISFQASAQQAWSTHRAVTLDEIYAQWDGITKEYQVGISILRPPQKVKFKAKYLSHPQPCNVGLLQMVMNTLGVPDFLKRAPVSQCIKFTSESGREVTAWIQDVLAPGFAADAQIDSQLEFYADFLAYNVSSDKTKNMPVMLVARFVTT